MEIPKIFWELRRLEAGLSGFKLKEYTMASLGCKLSYTTFISLNQTHPSLPKIKNSPPPHLRTRLLPLSLPRSPFSSPFPAACSAIDDGPNGGKGRFWQPRLLLPLLFLPRSFLFVFPARPRGGQLRKEVKLQTFPAHLELYFHFCVGFLMFSFLLLVFIRPTHLRAISGHFPATASSGESRRTKNEFK